MKFTEALRRADLLELPDLRGTYIEPYIIDWGGEKPPCCAIGGAAVAAGLWEMERTPYDDFFLTANSRDSAQLFDKFGLDDDYAEYIQYPCCTAGSAKNLRMMVIHFYDFHHYSRTQIADLLDQQPWFKE